MKPYQSAAKTLHFVKLNIELGFNIKPYTTQKIEGRISIPESGKTFDVSMGVAEFEQTGPDTFERKEFGKDAINSLNPSLPVWVPIHGRKASEKSNTINELALQLSLKGQQVITVDWHEAARDNDMLIGELAGASWIPSVGAWVVNQLKVAGFTGDKVIVAGPSWGSFVAYEIGSGFKEGDDGNGFGIQAIVAMDSPLDVLPNSFQSSNVVFNDVSRVSWSIKSSIFGSDTRSNTAHVNFEIVPPSEISEQSIFMPPMNKMLIDTVQAYFGEHGYATSYFSNLIAGMGDESLSVLNINDLIDGKTPQITVNPHKIDGILPVTLREVTGPEGTYWQAVPVKLSNP